MDPTPTTIQDFNEDIVECEDSEKNTRLTACTNCENFTIEDGITKCSQSGCLINLMITYTFKQCPLEKW